VHSRAAKRASSPSIDTDKSLKNVQPPTELKSHRPSVLAVHQSAGVTKKSKNGRKSVLSAKAKRRQERGMDRAEAVMDRTETKVQKSKVRARSVQERAKAWDELNKNVVAAANKQAILESAELDDAEDNEMDVEASETPVVEVQVAAQSIPLPEDDDEIL
jgi:hypothetical protein